MNQRPGFMLYFEVMPALDILNDEEAGRLFRALMAYGRYGEVRDLSGAEAVAFQMLRGRMDRDAVAYREKCCKKAYAAYVSAARRRGEIPMEYEDWNGGQMQADVCSCMPTATATTNAAATTNANTIVTPNTTSIANTERKQPMGEISTEFPTMADSDTAWVLPFLEESKKRVKHER